MDESEAPGPDAILFDLGGLLMNFGGLRRLAELSGDEDGPVLRSKWARSKWLQLFERGECSAHAFGEGVVDDWGLDLTPAELLDDFARWSAGPFRDRWTYSALFTGLSAWVV